MKLRLFGMACGAWLALLTGLTYAQSFPVKPIRILVPYAPGGLVDNVARVIGPQLAAKLGQPVVIDNRPGAAGAIAMDVLKHNPADGHTLLLADPALVINPVIQPQLSYRAARDMQAITQFATTGLILAVHPSVPAADVQGLIRYARGNLALNFSSPGIGTVPHMAAELFKVRTQVNAVHVPYKGGNAALADVLAGQIQMVFFTPSVILPFIRDGRMKALAYTGSHRSLVAPELQTMKEAGVADFEANVWLLFGTRSGTPPAIVNQLNRALVAIARSDDIRATLAKSDVQTIGGTAQDATGLLDAEEKRWEAVAKSNRIGPEK